MTLVEHREQAMQAQFGSFEWGAPRNGRLSRIEKLTCIRTLAFLAVREATDVVRAACGLVRPAEAELGDLAPPDSRLVKETEQHARETHSKTLLFHCYRTYYFGRLLSAYDRIKCDPELLFATAMLHDLAIANSASVSVKDCCFAVSGGRQAYAFLITKDYPPETAEVVRDAISAHVNLHLPVKRYGEVAALVTKGAVCDVFGFERRRLGNRFKADLLRTFPPGDLKGALLAPEDIAPDTRLAFYSGLSGGLPEHFWTQSFPL